MKTSSGFEESRDRAIGHLLEIGLYRDHPRVMLLCLQALAGQAAQLGRSLLAPCLLFILPLVVLVLPLARYNDYRPLHPGESVLLVVTGKDLSQPRITTSEGLLIDSEAVKISSQNEVVWRLSALSEGDHTVQVSVGENRWDKSLQVSRDPGLVSLSRSSNWAHWLLHPYESKLDAEETVSGIRVDYPQRQFWFGDHRIPWLVPFLITFLASLILIGRFR